MCSSGYLRLIYAKIGRLHCCTTIIANHLAYVTRSGLSAPQLRMQAAPKKKFEKGQFERRARMEPDKLEALLFQFFEREVHLTLSHCCHGPVQRLAEILNQLLYAYMSSQVR